MLHILEELLDTIKPSKTTSKLLFDILKNCKKDVRLVGNIGNPWEMTNSIILSQYMHSMCPKNYSKPIHNENKNIISL